MHRLVRSDTVDGFSHRSPDSRSAAYVCFPEGTPGHPPDVDVHVVVVSTTDCATRGSGTPSLGGQGTLNVNRWSLESTQAAFVGYPLPDKAGG
jgi:hypothetical protein